MSAGNLFYTREKAFGAKTKAVTSTHTVNVGGVAYNFYEQRVITVTDPTASFTLSVPNGAYEGQELLITFISDASGVTITVTTTTGADYSLTAAGDYVRLEWMNSTVGWVALKEVTT